MAMEQWGFFSVPHLRGTSVYNGHLRGPVTLTPIAERLAGELSLPRLEFEKLNMQPSACRTNALTLENMSKQIIKLCEFNHRDINSSNRMSSFILFASFLALTMHISCWFFFILFFIFNNLITITRLNRSIRNVLCCSYKRTYLVVYFFLYFFSLIRIASDKVIQ